MPTICHQRKIRDHYSLIDPQPSPELSNCHVSLVTKEQAAPIILKYEWLQTMNKFMYGCGLFHEEDLLGVVCFGIGPGTRSRYICGEKYAHLAVCLERGACVHYAPHNSASYLISRATKLLHTEYGYKIFFAYSDPAAGETGTVYQACNWMSQGQSPGRFVNDRIGVLDTITGERISERTRRNRGLYMPEVRANPDRYKLFRQPDK